MLAWLPVNRASTTGPVKPSQDAEDQFKHVSALPSVSCTRVLWYSGCTIGCLLAYRSTPEGVASIRAAADEVVSLCKWGARKEIEHRDPMVNLSPNQP